MTHNFIVHSNEIACKKGGCLGLYPIYYKEVAKDGLLRKIQADRVHLAIKGGHTFWRWCKGLSLMFEKIPGAKRFEKFSPILLTEADIKLVKKLLIGVFMM